MNTSQCPRCNAEVSLPQNASSKAKVSCPLCSEEFILSEILDSMPPALVVVEDPEPPAAAAAAAKESSNQFSFGEGGNDADGDYKLADADDGPAAPFSFDEQDAPQRSSSTSYRSRPKPKKKSSATMEIVKVVLGGAAGIAIGLLILWWGFGKDVADFGKNVSLYVPSIVPAKLHHPSLKEQSEKPADDPENATPNDSVFDDDNDPSRGTGGEDLANQTNTQNGNFNSGNPTTSGDNSLTGDLGLGNVVDDDLGLPNIPEPDLGEDAGLELADPTTITLPNEEDDLLPATEDDLVPGPGTAPTPKPLKGIIQAPKFTNEQFSEALADVIKATQQLEATAAPDPQLKLKVLESLANLSEMVAVLDLENGQNVQLANDTRTVAKGLLSSPELKQIVAGGGRGWLSYDKRSTEGAILLGTVKTFAASGKNFHTKVTLGTTDEQVTIISALHPQDYCNVGDQIIILGRIVTEPKKSIVGYDGPDGQVVWAGMFVTAES